MSERLWSNDDTVALVHALAPKVGQRGPYEGRLSLMSMNVSSGQPA